MYPLASAACAVASNAATASAPVEQHPLHRVPPFIRDIRAGPGNITRNTLWRVGQEIVCTASSDGRRAEGRAQLETDELLFRGEGLRLRIPYSSVTDVRAADGVLEVDHDGATSTFELGDRAVRWADRIRNPKTVIDKLGVKPGQRVALRGMDADGFAGDLAARGAELVEGDADHLFVAVETQDDLAALRGPRPADRAQRRRLDGEAQGPQGSHRGRRDGGREGGRPGRRQGRPLLRDAHGREVRHPGRRPVRIALLAPAWFAVPPVRYGGIEWVVSHPRRRARRPRPRRHAVRGGRLADQGASSSRATTSRRPTASGCRCPTCTTRSPASSGPGDFDVVNDHSGPLACALGQVDRDAVLPHRPRPAHAASPGSCTPRSRGCRPRVRLISLSRTSAAPLPELNWLATCHNAIDLDELPVHPGNDGYLLFLGRMSPDKGAGNAVRVAREVGLPLKLAGKIHDPIEHEYFDAAVRPYLGDRHRVRRRGVARGEGATCCSRPLLTVFPIQWPEPFGLVMVESMACGTPVLATAPRRRPRGGRAAAAAASSPTRSTSYGRCIDGAARARPRSRCARSPRRGSRPSGW